MQAAIHTEAWGDRYRCHMIFLGKAMINYPYLPTYLPLCERDKWEMLAALTVMCGSAFKNEQKFA